MCRFLPAPSVRRAIDFSKHKRKGSSIFLSTPSARRATKRVTQKGGDRRFLSTPSARRATSRRAIRSLMGAYFYPRPPRGGRQSCPHSRLQRLGISIHALREEGDHLPRSWHLAAANFYPRPPRGGRPSRQTKMVSALRFLSTPSARRATRAFHSTVPGLRYFYPRPPRGGRQSCPHSRLQRLGISIHALREEGDLHPGDVDWPPVISIHALREEGDISSSAVFSAMGVFLSTPSARRATPEWRGMLRSGCNFYPRPPRGGRRRGVWLFSTCPHISIHALREEGDVCAIYDISELISFLSTPSARRATCCGPRGGDSGCYFYPRPPRGGRLNTYEQRLAATGFLSTPSARRATATATSLGYSVEISIHALREEGDPGAVQGRDLRPDISIHALREEGDLRMLLNSALISLFLSTPSARRATSSCQTDFCGSTDFYPRPPRGGRPTTRRRWGARNGNFYPRPPRGGRPSSGILPTPLDSHFYPRPPRGGRPRRLCRPRRKREFLSTPSARRATCSGQACASHRKYFYPRPPRGGRP